MKQLLHLLSHPATVIPLMVLIGLALHSPEIFGVREFNDAGSFHSAPPAATDSTPQSHRHEDARHPSRPSPKHPESRPARHSLKKSGAAMTDGGSPSVPISHVGNLPSFSATHPWIPVDPTSTGHRLHFIGKSARVLASQSVEGSTAPALSIEIDDEAPPPLASDPISPTPAFPETAALAPSGIPHASRVQWGLTYEQQLFRTKWGWAAFDQVQKTMITDSN